MIRPIDFQDNAANWLLEKTTNSNSKKILVVNAPTGCGKTIILIKYVKRLFEEDKNIAIVWLCPGKGNLEEQSKNRMQTVFPALKTKDLFDALNTGFERCSTTFINWEKVTKKDNKAITESEKNNLYDEIKIAHNKGIKFVIIIDEEHSNNTAKANDLLRYFDAIHTIRVSATTVSNTSQVEYLEIDEQEVIDEGLITKAISVNEGVTDGMTQDDSILLEIADKKRKEILEAYNGRIRPLVLIQFPNGEPDKIKAVEAKLAAMNYTRKNGMVAAWLSGDNKDIPNDLVQNDSQLAFLFIKQAINTGWDCPRAKILVKLREGGEESFQIQTIGRIRRMPEGHHYNIRVLDMCYIYTFDKRYHSELMSSLDKSYTPKRVFLKEKCKGVSLPKELKDLDGGVADFNQTYNLIYKHFIDKYNLTNDKEDNKEKLQAKGYHFKNYLMGEIASGIFVKTIDVAEAVNAVETHTPVDTHEHSLLLRHVINDFKTIVGIQYEQMRPMMDKLFSFKYKSNFKLLNLGIREYYAFIINNQHTIKQELREISSNVLIQNRCLMPKLTTFTIPLEEIYPYDPTAKNPEIMKSNAYEDYTSAYVTSNCRKSDPEIMFENFCENCEAVDWVYKNGDLGQDYLSVVFSDNFNLKQKSFYPDYIVRLKDGSIWILEAKGGQKGKQDQNIDIQVLNKFETFKRYAEQHNLNWGFVRPYNQKLYVNNTKYSVDITSDAWVSLSDIFK